jgi:hypothetical protein
VSRSDTLRQKIERNINFLYKISAQLDLKYNHIRVFYYIQGMCSLVVESDAPLWKINFYSEIDLLEEVLADNNFSKLKEDKTVMNLYNYVTATNKMIEAKYKFKIKMLMNFDRW